MGLVPLHHGPPIEPWSTSRMPPSASAWRPYRDLIAWRSFKLLRLRKSFYCWDPNSFLNKDFIKTIFALKVRACQSSAVLAIKRWCQDSADFSTSLDHKCHEHPRPLRDWECSARQFFTNEALVSRFPAHGSWCGKMWWETATYWLYTSKKKEQNKKNMYILIQVRRDIIIYIHTYCEIYIKTIVCNRSQWLPENAPVLFTVTTSNIGTGSPRASACFSEENCPSEGSRDGRLTTIIVIWKTYCGLTLLLVGCRAFPSIVGQALCPSPKNCHKLLRCQQTSAIFSPQLSRS